MKKFTTFVGLDVHADTIAASVAERDGEVRSFGTFANRPESVRKFIKKLGDHMKLAVCYEAVPTGFALYWLLTGLGVYCEVVAPTRVPKKARALSDWHLSRHSLRSQFLGLGNAIVSTIGR